MQQFKLDTYSRFMYRGSLIGKIFANFEQFPHNERGTLHRTLSLLPVYSAPRLIKVRFHFELYQG